jgi:hypothetical protein
LAVSCEYLAGDDDNENEIVYGTCSSHDLDSVSGESWDMHR